jgi:hypothetical protein
VKEMVVRRGFLFFILFISTTVFAEPVEESDALFQTNYEAKACIKNIKNKANEMVSYPSTIKKYTFMTSFDGGYQNKAPSGYEGWLSFNNCKGNLVILVNRGCQYRNSYTLGNCQVEGVKKY